MSLSVVHLEDESWDSGIAHYALTLATLQKARGWNVEFWGLDGGAPLKAAAAAGLACRGFDGALAPWLRLRVLRGALASRGVSVLNAHTGSSHTLALALAAGTDVRVVRTRGDARPAKGGPFAGLIASRTAAFIGANSALSASLSAAYPSALVRHVPQGVPGPQQPPPLPAAPVVGLLGRLDPVKGHDVLLDAVAALQGSVPGLKAVCAGEGQLRDRLRWQLKPAGLEGVVELPGFVPDKWGYIASCRVGVVASTGSEAVSRAALEWMAAGRPVVASAVGGLPDLVEHGVTGLLTEPGDSKSLAQALAYVLADPKRAHDYGAAGRARWKAFFSPDPFFAATEAAYHEALHGPAR